jgi:hypothetical protein
MALNFYDLKEYLTTHSSELWGEKNYVGLSDEMSLHLPEGAVFIVRKKTAPDQKLQIVDLNLFVDRLLDKDVTVYGEDRVKLPESNRDTFFDIPKMYEGELTDYEVAVSLDARTIENKIPSYTKVEHL